MSRLLGLLILFSTTTVFAQDLTLGYNVGWIEGKYGHDLTSAYDRADWERVARRTREGGGEVMRVWLFEGPAREGVVWNGHRPVGVDPQMLEHVREVTRIAHAEGVKVYWTALSANWPDHWEKGTLASQRWYNVLTNRYGHGDRFRRDVLGPVLDVIAECPEAAYGLDLLNEVQGSVRTWFWSDGWRGARRWMRKTTSFVHARAPGVRVTVSSGHHTAASDILMGRFDGLGLDFLDVHVYTDGEQIPHGRRLARHARRRGVPMVLGEFGQAKDGDDPALQARVTADLLRHAERLGFEAAFAWRLEDSQRHDRRFSFYDGDTPRPALDVMRRFSAEGPPPRRRGLLDRLLGR